MWGHRIPWDTEKQKVKKILPRYFWFYRTFPQLKIADAQYSDRPSEIDIQRMLCRPSLCNWHPKKLKLYTDHPSVKKLIQTVRLYCNRRPESWIYAVFRPSLCNWHQRSWIGAQYSALKKVFRVQKDDSEVGWNWSLHQCGPKSLARSSVWSKSHGKSHPRFVMSPKSCLFKVPDQPKLSTSNRPDKSVYFMHGPTRQIVVPSYRINYWIHLKPAARTAPVAPRARILQRRETGVKVKCNRSKHPLTCVVK